MKVSYITRMAVVCRTEILLDGEGEPHPGGGKLHAGNSLCRVS